METYNVAYTSDATARRQRRCLLRAFAATVACERVPLLAWRAAVYECRQERRLASESALSSAAAVAATAKTAAKKPAPLPTAGTFRVVPIKGILAEVAALYQVIVPSHCIYIAFRPYQSRSSSTVEDPCSSNLDSKGIRCMDRRVNGPHSGWSVTLHAHLTVIDTFFCLVLFPCFRSSSCAAHAISSRQRQLPTASATRHERQGSL